MSHDPNEFLHTARTRILIGLTEPREEQAAVAANATYHPIITDVEAPLQKGMSDKTMESFRGKRLRLVAGDRGQSTIHREAKVAEKIVGHVALSRLVAVETVREVRTWPPQPELARRPAKDTVVLAVTSFRRILPQRLIETPIHDP